MAYEYYSSWSTYSYVNSLKQSTVIAFTQQMLASVNLGNICNCKEWIYLLQAQILA